MMASESPTSRIRVNVGGKNYSTKLYTVSQGRAVGSKLASMFTDDLLHDQYFIDRDPKCFGYLLQWLRDGMPIVVKSSAEQDRLLTEIQWYGPFCGGDPVVFTDNEYINWRISHDVNLDSAVQIKIHPCC